MRQRNVVADFKRFVRSVVALRAGGFKGHIRVWFIRPASCPRKVGGVLMYSDFEGEQTQMSEVVDDAEAAAAAAPVLVGQEARHCHDPVTID